MRNVMLNIMGGVYMTSNLVSFEELHLEFKAQGLVKEEFETEAVLILFCYEGLLEKQVFKDTNTIWYRRIGKTREDLIKEMKQRDTK